MDLVYNLLYLKRFCQYSNEEKINLKNRGRPLPDLVIENEGVSRGRAYKRKFNREIYSRNDWICGSYKKNALFCFPCLLFGGDKSWTEVGVADLVHINNKMKKHDNSQRHLYNTMELVLIGTANFNEQLDSAYWVNAQKHNDNVTKNRYVLSKIINCIKFCGALEFVLRGHEDNQTSQNPSLLRGLINFSAELDATLSEHLQNASIFKETSKDIQNDLLDCILEVCHEEIIKEINRSSFLAIIVEEITDVSENTQLVVILRYILDGDPIERFWTYLNPAKYDAATLSKNILSIIDPLVKKSSHKLISQSYNGGAVMTGVQAIIKEKYPNAHFVHCYAHQLNQIISKAASFNSQVRVFFGSLKEISEFFNNSPQHVEVFKRIKKGRTPECTATDWNFNVRTVNIVFENRQLLIECMEEIEEQFNNETVCSAASSIRRMLQDFFFVFWLTFFHNVMPHVDVLFNKLQKENNDPTQIQNAIDSFEISITNVRNNIDLITKASSNVCMEPKEGKTNHRTIAVEVCNLIINSAQDRFMFKDHLQAASLFFSEYFGEYYCKFPEDKLASTCEAYSTLENERLKTELSVIYSRNDCRCLNGVLPLLKFIIENNLNLALRETKKLLEIVATTPMCTSEPERCFSTLKRIKTFLRNSMSQDRLTALTMLSIEKLFISKIDNFNDKVIDKFASLKDHKIELTFKKREHYQMPTEPAEKRGSAKENSQDKVKSDTVAKGHKRKRISADESAMESSENGFEDDDGEQKEYLTEQKTSAEDAQDVEKVSPFLHVDIDMDLDIKEEPTRLIDPLPEEYVKAEVVQINIKEEPNNFEDLLLEMETKEDVEDDGFLKEQGKLECHTLSTPPVIDED